MESLITEYGVLALAFFLFIDDLGVPFPTSTILFSSAVLARTNPEISLWSLVMIALIIPPISNGILFLASRRGLRHWLGDNGHRVFLTKKRLRKAEKFFDKYGDRTVFIAAMITSIRPVSSVIAGSLGMNYTKFFAYHLAGVVVWATGIFSIGYFLGDQIWYFLQQHWLGLLGLVALLFIIKFIIWTKK
jgi:membrane-associated protein